MQASLQVVTRCQAVLSSNCVDEADGLRITFATDEAAAQQNRASPKQQLRTLPYGIDSLVSGNDLVRYANKIVVASRSKTARKKHNLSCKSHP